MTYDPHEKKMHLMDHLRELRKRLIISCIVIAVGAICAYMYAGEIFAIVCAPYFAAFPNSPLIGTSPTEAWVLKLKVSVFAGALLTSPILFYQLWLFVAPGLYAHERKLVVPFIALSTALFCGGAFFCYRMVLPLTFAFFHDEFTSIGVTPTIRVGDQVSMTITALAGFGAVFELPLLTFFLSRIGVIDHTFLLSWFKHAVVIIFVIAAVLTPPDVLTQFLMAGPLMILYVISIGIAYVAAPRVEQLESAPATPNHHMPQSGSATSL
jgi:sec-independent protein translocase protein TatC